MFPEPSGEGPRCWTRYPSQVSLACPTRAYMEEDSSGEGFGSRGRVGDLRELQPPV
jgi:hypothetical protein